MTAEIHNKVIHIIGAVRSPKEEITSETILKELGIGDLDRLELIMRLEDQFRVCIDDEQFNQCITVSEWSTYIESIKS